MFCSACEIEVALNDKKHYRSAFHTLNVQGKVNNEPLLVRTGKVLSCPQEIFEEDFFDKSKLFCIFCPQQSLQIEGDFKKHMLVHGFEIIDCATFLNFIHNSECPVCSKQLSSLSGLRNHLLSHTREAKEKTKLFKVQPVNFTEKNGLVFLDNGKCIRNRDKILLSKNKIVEKKNSFSETRVTQQSKSEKISISRICNRNSKNNLKISLKKNYQPHYEPQWMQ